MHEQKTFRAKALRREFVVNISCYVKIIIYKCLLCSSASDFDNVSNPPSYYLSYLASLSYSKHLKIVEMRCSKIRHCAKNRHKTRSVQYLNIGNGRFLKLSMVQYHLDDIHRLLKKTNERKRLGYKCSQAEKMHD
jgi:hypothetical protein